MIVRPARLARFLVAGLLAIFLAACGKAPEPPKADAPASAQPAKKKAAEQDDPNDIMKKGY